MAHRKTSRLGVWLAGAGCAAALVLAAGVSTSAGQAGETVTDEKPAVGEWSQWRGPNRDGVSTETGWLTDWPADGPKVLWKKSVGDGYSSIAVADGKAYTMGNSGGTDAVFCFDVETGRELWKKTYKCKAGGYKGPRGTPAVDEGRVYTLSREGLLVCWDAKTGKRNWFKDMARSYGTSPPQWGFACSPLVHGDLLIVDVGTLVAFDKVTGKQKWKSDGFKPGYGSPMASALGSGTIIATFNEHGLLVVNARNGSEVGRYRWRTQYGANVVTPIVSGDKVFISSGYNVGCAVIQIGKGKPTSLWKSGKMRNHFNNCVLYKGHFYGFDEKTLRCLEFATGEEKWSKGGLGKGSLMLADGKLIVLSDRGSLQVADATPTGYKTTAQAKVLSGTCWTMPVLSGGRIFCRSYQGDLVCLDVRKKK